MLNNAKKIFTKDSSGKENGYLIELSKQGKLTTSYLTCTYPGSFKGYHLHKIRTANYICIKGEIKIILYTAYGKKEYLLSSNKPQTLNIPINTPTGLLNEGTEEAWIINHPFPAYDPDLIGEQIEYTQEQLDCLYESPNSASKILQGMNMISSLEYLKYLPDFEEIKKMDLFTTRYFIK